MMANNVRETYGSSRFPNMDICAKSGTAEVGGGKSRMPGLPASCATPTPPTPLSWSWRRAAAAPMQQAMWPLKFWTLWSTATDTCSVCKYPRRMFPSGYFVFYLKISCNFHIRSNALWGMVIVRIIPGLSCPQAEKIRSPASYSPVYPMEPVGKESARCPLVPMPNKSFKALWPPVCPMQPYAAPWRAKNFPVVGSIWSLPEKQPGRWLNALPRCWETASPPAWWSPSTTTARAKSPLHGL